MNFVSDVIIKLLSESDFKHADNRITIMGIVDEFSLKIIDEDVENIEMFEISEMR